MLPRLAPVACLDVIARNASDAAIPSVASEIASLLPGLAMAGNPLTGVIRASIYAYFYCGGNEAEYAYCCRARLSRHLFAQAAATGRPLLPTCPNAAAQSLAAWPRAWDSAAATARRSDRRAHSPTSMPDSSAAACTSASRAGSSMRVSRGLFRADLSPLPWRLT